MAELSVTKWVRYEPSIPGNLELPVAERFYLEVCAGLSMAQYDAISEGANKLATVEDPSVAADLAHTLSVGVKLGNIALKLNGTPITTLEEYLAAVLPQRGVPLIRELFQCLAWHNSWEGLKEVFSVRSFGGSTGTASKPTVPVGSQTAAP